MSPAASTPKPIAFASKKRGFYAFCAAVLTLLSFLPGTGEAAAGACRPTEEMFKNHDTSAAGIAVPETAFLKGDGSETSLRDYRGKAIVLNFWATWCAPCVKEMPQLDRLSALVRGNGVEVLAVSEDRKGLVLAPRFYRKNNLNDLDVLVDRKSALSRALKIRGLPSTVLITPDGREIGRVTGIAEWDSPDIVDYVRNCLGSSS